MILLINTCADKLSEHEFVKPIKALVHDECFIKHYSELTNNDLLVADKIIICGTALMDFDYLKGDWSWIKAFNKPVLGICAGFQVIALELGKELVDKKMIGVFDHNYFVTSKLVEGGVTELRQGLFTAYAFHPEVLNPELISGFCRSQ
ncbi:MAG: hypothetical protein WC307_00480 [Candidatus Nanoarchaeia archaeon]|jgi:GMP synthase (glutamine-hydrolysing)